MAKSLYLQVRGSSIADKYLAQLRPDHILAWRDSLVNLRTGKPLADSSKSRYQKLLEVILKRKGYRVIAPKPTLQQPEIRILTKAEQSHLINRAVQPRTKLALMILLYLGVRNAEACGLKHEDRFEEGVWIRRQIDKGGKVKNKLKTDRSNAWIPMPKDLQALIGPPKRGFVIGVSEDKPMHPDNLRRMVHSVAEHTAYEGLNPLDMRHTALVNLLRAGVDPATAASITRHSVDTALKIYHRAIPEAKTEAMKRLEAWRQGA